MYQVVLVTLGKDLACDAVTATSTRGTGTLYHEGTSLKNEVVFSQRS